MQVVTSENIMQLHETGKVDEFKPPEVKADDAKPDEKPKADEVKADIDKPKEKDDKESAGAKPEDDEDDLPEKVRQKIGKKHRAMKEAEEYASVSIRERIAAERRADQLERENAELKSKSGPKPKDSKEPNPDDFKTVAEYADALTDYKLEKKLEEHRVREETKRQQAAASEIDVAFQKRIASTIKEYPDYEEVIGAADADVPAHIAQFIVEDDDGVKIGYHLAKNPKELDRIRDMSPIRAIAELGKLVTRLDKKPEAKAQAEVQAVSRAPAPIQPLEGKSAVVEKDPAKMSFQELRAWDIEQRSKRTR